MDTCALIAYGKAAPNRTLFPDKLTLDEAGEPVLTDDASDEEWEAHDGWLAESCEHNGFLLSLFLGNIPRIGHLRSFPRGLEGKRGPAFRFFGRRFSTTVPTAATRCPMSSCLT